jgi:hypothetical protein
MTAAEKALADIEAALDKGEGWPVGTLMEVNRIIGAYSMERIGESE